MCRKGQKSRFWGEKARIFSRPDCGGRRPTFRPGGRILLEEQFSLVPCTKTPNICYFEQRNFVLKGTELHGLMMPASRWGQRSADDVRRLRLLPTKQRPTSAGARRNFRLRVDIDVFEPKKPKNVFSVPHVFFLRRF